MADWPKHPDGRPMKFGEMTHEQQRVQMAQACKRVKSELESPEMARAIAEYRDDAEIEREMRRALTNLCNSRPRMRTGRKR